MAGKIQKQDIKTEAELIAGGGTAADLANDTQVYVTALGINKTLDDAITDGDITDSAANANLSNLTGPTNINQDFIFDTGTGAVIQTMDDPDGSQSFELTTGNSNTAGITGEIVVSTGNNTGSGGSNRVLIKSGDTDSGESGIVEIQSGASTSGNSGGIALNPGSAGGTRGNVSITSEFLYLTDLNATIKTPNDTEGGPTNDLSISTGNSTGDDSGNISISPGTAGGTRGKILLVDGSEGTAGEVWTSTDTAGSGTWAPFPAAFTDTTAALSADTTTTTADTYIDVTGASISLTPGTWDIYFEGSLSFAAVLSLTIEGNLAITNSSDIIQGNSLPYYKKILVSLGTNVVDHIMFCVREITVASTTTYKLRLRNADAAANSTISVLGAASQTGGLTNPDVKSVFYARRVQ